MKKIIVAFFVIAALLALAYAGHKVVLTYFANGEITLNPKMPMAGSTRLNEMLDLKIKTIDELFRNKDVVEQVMLANSSNENISQKDILDKDLEWRQSEGLPDFVKGKMINECADRLFKFESLNEEFVETFVTDKRGLNVCLTTKTTDYYQADEAWWVSAFNYGEGRAFFGNVEYDESSRSQVVPLYVPVRDPETHEVIGVGKALIDIIFLKGSSDE